MHIKFVCLCGKRLKARREMAGRRTSCPACGAPVGIPSLLPTQRGATACQTSTLHNEKASQTGQKHGLPNRILPAAARADADPLGKSAAAQRFKNVTPEQIVVVRRRRHLWEVSKRRRLETRWYQSLMYASRHVLQIPALAVALTLCIGGLALLLPKVWHSGGTLGYWPGFCLVSLLSIAVLGHTSVFLSRVLKLAVRGDVHNVPAPPFGIELALGSAWQWTRCFLSGPALLIAMSTAYWLHCGELKLLDWIILAELTIPAITYWLICLAVTVIQGRAYVAPGEVLQAARFLGNRFLTVIVLVALFACGHFYLAITALEELHQDLVLGFLLLSLSIGSGLYVGMSFLRVYGLRYFRATKPGRMLVGTSR